MERVIGVDFDNTLVSYDALVYDVARRRDLVPESTPRSKPAVRDAIRRSAGDEAWHAVQTVIYGERMGEARLIDGVAAFFARARRQGVPVFIVSHKAEQTEAGGRRVRLREAALRWMARQRFFEPDGLGLARSHVHFEPTRAGKLSRIRALACTHFVDDLAETFLEPAFPDGVRKILYAPHGASVLLPGMTACATWSEIGDACFDA
jgi:hypothetical protein